MDKGNSWVTHILGFNTYSVTSVVSPVEHLPKPTTPGFTREQRKTVGLFSQLVPVFLY